MVMQQVAPMPTETTTLSTSTTQQPGPLLRFTVQQSRLSHALSLVLRAVSKSTIDIEKMPLLGCIRMEVKDGLLLLAATNLEISVTAKVELPKPKQPGAMQEVIEGVVAVPARLLSDLVGKMSECQVQVTCAAGTYMLSLEHSLGTAEIKCLSAEEFLPIPGAEDGELPVLLPVTGLKEVIKAVSVAVSKDESLQTLTCLFVHIEKSRVVFAATDKFRTAHQTLQLPTPSEVNSDLLIPARSLAELASILNDGMVMMSVTPNNGQVIFHTQWVTLSSRLVEGKFPNYQAAIPTKEQTQTTITIQTQQFKEVVALTSIYAQAADSGVVCLSARGSLGMEQGRLTVSSENTEMGSGQNTIAAAVEGIDQEQPIHFNAKLLGEPLAVITTKEIQLVISLMRIKAGDDFITAYAGVLKPVGSNTCTYSFMSMVVNG